MNVNPLKKIWAEGGTAIGSYVMYSRDIATIEIAAAAGLDFVLFDLEHRLHDSAALHDLCQVARLGGMAAVVGPRDITPHAISHVLDLGASGVVIPHVETPQEVALAIEAVRYPPRGKRGRCGSAGHNLYNVAPMAAEIAHYNSDVALLLKVESGAAIERLEELVGPEDVDGVMVGPMDLSLNLGIPGQMDHTQIVELIEHVRAVCRQRQIHYGTLVSTATGVSGAMDEGASWIAVGSEMEFISTAWKAASAAKKR